MEEVVKFERLVAEYSGHFEIRFECSMKGYLYTTARIDDVVDRISSVLKIPRDELRNIVKGIAEKHGFNKEFLTFTVDKTNKTAEEIKAEIKEITRKVESFINEMIEKAIELRKKIDLSDWIYEKMVFDWNKGRFVKA